MANTVPVCVTIDRDVIIAWAHRRNGRPATMMGDERPWPLLFEFGPPEIGVKEVGWDLFFAEFERANLAFVFRVGAENGAADDFHEFINRATVPELAISATVTMNVI